MAENAYKKLMDKQQEEFNAFPMFYAFDQKQFEEGMISFGLKPTDTDKIYSMSGTGGYYRKSDSQALRDMFSKHHAEVKQAIELDKTGLGFVYDMFAYELGNHEYSYTMELDDTLKALGLTMEEINNNEILQCGLQKACRYQEAS